MSNLKFLVIDRPTNKIIGSYMTKREAQGAAYLRNNYYGANRCEVRERVEEKEGKVDEVWFSFFEARVEQDQYGPVPVYTVRRGFHKGADFKVKTVSLEKAIERFYAADRNSLGFARRFEVA